MPGIEGSSHNTNNNSEQARHKEQEQPSNLQELGARIVELAIDFLRQNESNLPPRVREEISNRVVELFERMDELHQNLGRVDRIKKAAPTATYGPMKDSTGRTFGIRQIPYTPGERTQPQAETVPSQEADSRPETISSSPALLDIQLGENAALAQAVMAVHEANDAANKMYRENVLPKIDGEDISSKSDVIADFLSQLYGLDAADQGRVQEELGQHLAKMRSTPDSRTYGARINIKSSYVFVSKSENGIGISLPTFINGREIDANRPGINLVRRGNTYSDRNKGLYNPQSADWSRQIEQALH